MNFIRLSGYGLVNAIGASNGQYVYGKFPISTMLECCTNEDYQAFKVLGMVSEA